MQCNANQTMAMNPFAHIKFDMCSIWRLVFSSLIIPGTGSVRLCRRMHVRCECLSMVAATLCALDSVCMWVCGINQNRQSQFRVQHSAAVCCYLCTARSYCSAVGFFFLILLSLLHHCGLIYGIRKIMTHNNARCLCRSHANTSDCDPQMTANDSQQSNSPPSPQPLCAVAHTLNNPSR